MFRAEGTEDRKQILYRATMRDVQNSHMEIDIPYYTNKFLKMMISMVFAPNESPDYSQLEDGISILQFLPKTPWEIANKK